MKCKECSGEIKGYGKKFCSRSCAASHNNRGVRRHGKEPGQCGSCGESLKDKKGKKFCSSSCQQELRWVNKKALIERTGCLHKPSSSSYTGSPKRYLLETRGHKCEICGQTEWMGKPIPLVFDHIDGHSENGKIENCRLVCGNCDMQLPTYKSKNKGNGRHSRRQRYKQGKSY